MTAARDLGFFPEATRKRFCVPCRPWPRGEKADLRRFSKEPKNSIMKNVISLTALICGLSLSLSLKAECVEGEKHPASASTDTQAFAKALASKEGTLSFKVSKMSCMSCAAKIRKALKTDLGLQDVEVDVDTKTVHVPCSASKGCSKELVSASLAKAGYPVESTP